ncbi:galactosyl transferase GMA12/MNN10 family-domain-containing protein [Hyaloraphidium curvatum]|nr:galactosyl transferase GMA12/MNN10 family-domain-containing protein [Hyaloraphidium curvatum]
MPLQLETGPGRLGRRRILSMIRLAAVLTLAALVVLSLLFARRGQTPAPRLHAVAAAEPAEPEFTLVNIASPGRKGPWLHMSLLNKQRFVRRNGHRWALHLEALWPGDAMWSKIPAMELTLFGSSRIDGLSREAVGRTSASDWSEPPVGVPEHWAWWLDLDTLITNLSVPLAGVVAEAKLAHRAAHPDGPELEMILSRDCNGINAGSYMIRRSAWSRDYLSRLWSMRAELAVKDPERASEQDAMARLFETDPEIRARTAFAPQTVLNGNAEEIGCTESLEDGTNGRTWQHGDFVIHFAGSWAHWENLMRRNGMDPAARKGKTFDTESFLFDNGKQRVFAGMERGGPASPAAEARGPRPPEGAEAAQAEWDGRETNRACPHYPEAGAFCYACHAPPLPPPERTDASEGVRRFPRGLDAVLPAPGWPPAGRSDEFATPDFGEQFEKLPPPSERFRTFPPDPDRRHRKRVRFDPRVDVRPTWSKAEYPARSLYAADGEVGAETAGEFRDTEAENENVGIEAGDEDDEDDDWTQVGYPAGRIDGRIEDTGVLRWDSVVGNCSPLGIDGNDEAERTLTNPDGDMEALREARANG